MQEFPRLALLASDYDGGIDIEWHHSSYTAFQGCATILAISFPELLSLCWDDKFNGDLPPEQIPVHYIYWAGIHQNAHPGQSEYVESEWDWLNQPDPRTILDSTEDIVSAISSETLLSFVTEARDMVDNVRTYLQRPLAPGELPAEWAPNIPLSGGRLFRQGHRFFWLRINLTAEQNIISPVEDERHIRFLTFNQGPMELPEVSKVFTRHISEVGITPDTVQLETGDDFTSADIERFTQFYIDGTESRLIGNITHREYFVNSRGGQVLRIRYDPYWEQGEFTGESEVEIGFA